MTARVQQPPAPAFAVHDGTPGDDGAALMAGWFSRLFRAAPDAGFVELCRQPSFIDFMEQLGEDADREDACRRMVSTLAAGSSQEAADGLNRLYVRLFEGGLGRDGIGLYESAYTGSGRLFQEPVAQMQSVLRLLNMSVQPSYKEPADHLSIQLAALAAALTAGETAVATALTDRILHWTAPMAADLALRDSNGFYSATLSLLTAFLGSLRSSSARPQSNGR